MATLPETINETLNTNDVLTNAGIFVDTLVEGLGLNDLLSGAVLFVAVRVPIYGDKFVTEDGDNTLNFEWKNVEYEVLFESAEDPVYVAVNSPASEQAIWGDELEGLKESDDDCGEWLPEEVNSERFGVEIGYEVVSGALAAAGYSGSDIGDILSSISVEDITIEVFYEQELSFGTLPDFGDSLLKIERRGPVAIAVGAGGLIVRETDAETNSWEDISPGTSGFVDDIHEVTYVDSLGKYIIAGKNGFLAESSDNGDTWTRIASPTNQHIFNAKLLGGKTILGGSNDITFVGSDFSSFERGQVWVNPYTPRVPCYSAGVQISTLNYTGTSINVQSDMVSSDDPRNIRVENDGTKLFFFEWYFSGGDQYYVHQYDLTNGDITTLSNHQAVLLNSGNLENGPTGFFIHPQGTKVWWSDFNSSAGNGIYGRSINNAFDLSGGLGSVNLEHTKDSLWSSRDTNIWISFDGTKYFTHLTLEAFQDELFPNVERDFGLVRYDLSTPFDLSTRTMHSYVNFADGYVIPPSGQSGSYYVLDFFFDSTKRQIILLLRLGVSGFEAVASFSLGADYDLFSVEKPSAPLYSDSGGFNNNSVEHLVLGDVPGLSGQAWRGMGFSEAHRKIYFSNSDDAALIHEFDY